MRISRSVTIQDDEFEFVAIRASGPGGQNVNKVSSAVQLFFDIQRSSLPEKSKAKLLGMQDSRITRDGVVIIKAQKHRSQEKNKAEALERLRTLIKSSLIEPKRRKATKPKAASRQKRLDRKKKHSRNKLLRRKIQPE